MHWFASSRSRVSTEAVVAGALTVAFIAITAWWLTRDRRVPPWDPGWHTSDAFLFRDALASGDLLAPLTAWTRYPPLVHCVGALGVLVTGREIWSVVLAQNLVFVPLLVLGCFQTGKLVYGDARAGLLAVVFALGTPMVVGQFHAFMLDAPEAAMVAVAVWLLLASRGFEQVDRAALAGLAIGLGMLTKQTFPVFIAGVVLVMAIRDGRRHWRGLLACVGVAALVAAPWYLRHLVELRDLATTLADAPTAPGLRPARFSIANGSWYLWSGLNYQSLAPLLGLAAIGAVLAAARLRAARPAHPLTLELLIGGLVAWLAVTWMLPHDPRYTLPALVYLAVLATGWIVRLPRPGRRIVQAALALVAIANVIGASTGLGERVTLALPGAPDSIVQQRRLTFYADDGYVFGAPKRSGDLLHTLRELRARGIRQIQWDPYRETPAFNNPGLRAFAEVAGLGFVTTRPQRAPVGEAVLLNRPIRRGQRPCVRLDDGTGVWVRTGDPNARVPTDACPRS